MTKLTSMVAIAVVLGAGTLLGAGAASAQGSRGIIAGRVMECAPGPVVASPPAPEPKSQPLVVTLYRNGAVVSNQAEVVLPQHVPWRQVPSPSACLPLLLTKSSLRISTGCDGSTSRREHVRW